MGKKKIETVEHNETDNASKSSVKSLETQFENIEKLLKEIVEILKRKHPSSTDIFGK